MDTATGALSNLETQREALENVKMNFELVKTLAQGAEALKSGLKESGGPDKIHDIIDDVSEQIEVSNEISESLKAPILYYEKDEDDLLRELGELLASPPSSPAASPLDALPDPPSTLPKDPEEESLAQLCQWAS